MVQSPLDGQDGDYNKDGTSREEKNKKRDKKKHKKSKKRREREDADLFLGDTV